MHELLFNELFSVLNKNKKPPLFFVWGLGLVKYTLWRVYLLIVYTASCRPT